MPFNPNEHLTTLKGKKYLEVKFRLIWFREVHKEDWGIETTPVVIDDQKAIFSAVIRDGNGKIIAMGTKMETPKGFPDYVEKAETGAIGRALAAAGYGTQFAPELEEGERIVDSPVELRVDYASILEAAQAIGLDEEGLHLVSFGKYNAPAVDLPSGLLRELKSALTPANAPKLKAYIAKQKGAAS